jgi:deoxyribonuclease IV
MLLLGAHLSIAGGLHLALLKAQKLHCNCVQIFVKNQRQWQAAALTRSAIEQWRQTRRTLGGQVLHVVAHGGYLINLASDSSAVRRRSVRSLRDELQRCRLLEIDRLVIHPGSHRGQGVVRGIKHVAKALNEVLPDVPGVSLLLEGTAGAGHCLGGTVEELSQLLDSSRFPERLGCCLDTCHLFAAGCLPSTDTGLAILMDAIDRQIGIDKVGCIHLNDSAGPAGSHMDRHAHIGKGLIGLDLFRRILNNEALMHIPKIIETPKGPGESLTFDRRNLGCLRGLCNFNSEKSP